MANTTLNNQAITSTFKELLTGLTEKEKVVIGRRAGITGNKIALGSIGKTFTPVITRERVRQIEENGIRKIGRIIKNTSLVEIHNTALNFVKLHGGILAVDALINNIIKELNLGTEANATLIEMILLTDENILRSKPRLGCRMYFHLPSITKVSVEEVHKAALEIFKRRKDVMSKTALYEAIAERIASRASMVFIDACLNLFEDIVYGEHDLVGLSKRKILNPRTLRDKIVYVLKKEKTPMHFIEIANKVTDYLKEQVKLNTIHNELIRNDEFVLIGRGIYALKEWGFTHGTVLDVIVGILEKNAGPMSTDEITKEVLRGRNVKVSTIYMNLQNKDRIERVGRNYYDLKR